MSLQSQWNSITNNIETLFEKANNVKGGVDKVDANSSSASTVDTTSETYLKSLFTNANTWNCTKRGLYNGRITPTRTHLSYTLATATTTRSHDTNQDWGWGDNYIGVRECYVYCSQAYALTTTLFTDDEGSLWLNGSQVTTTKTCESKSVTLNFKAGLNHVEIAFAEQSGGDAGYISTNLASQSWVKWMYARYKLM